jgi:predicted lipid-binding transport protein (Tim44 family)
VVEETESIIRLLEDSFLGLLSLSSVIFHRLLETVLRNIEKMFGDEMLFSGWESLTATDLLRKLSSADTYEEFLQAAAELRKKLSTEQQTFLEFLRDIDLIREKMHGQQQEKLSAKKKASKKSGFPSSQVIKTVIKSFEDMNQGKGVIVVSRQELETAIYSAWINADKEKANRLAVSEYIDKFEGVLWKKLNNGYYGMLVSSDKVITRIRDYVLELKQAKKNGQPPTNGNGSVYPEPLTYNENNGNGKPSADGNGSLGFTSLPTNGNGKYNIEQIIHTLQKEGKVFVPQQFLHEIVRELHRRGFSVNYWPATGLIELVDGDDEIPF